jgi:curved DNA-binding protein CbpA
VILGLPEGASLEEARLAQIELSRRFDPSAEGGSETVFAAVQEAYAILQAQAEAAARGEQVAGLAVVEVVGSMREVSDYLFAGDEESLTFARRREGMPDWLNETRRHTAVVAPVV